MAPLSISFHSFQGASKPGKTKRETDKDSHRSRQVNCPVNSPLPGPEGSASPPDPCNLPQAAPEPRLAPVEAPVGESGVLRLSCLAGRIGEIVGRHVLQGVVDALAVSDGF